MAHFNHFENDELDSDWQLKTVSTLTYEDVMHIKEGGVVVSAWMKHVLTGQRFRIIVEGERVGETNKDKNRFTIDGDDRLVKLYTN